MGSQCGGCGELEVGLEGEREERGAVVCVAVGRERKGINVVDDVINEVEKCGAREGERESWRKKKIHNRK